MESGRTDTELPRSPCRMSQSRPVESRISTGTICSWHRVTRNGNTPCRPTSNRLPNCASNGVRPTPRYSNSHDITSGGSQTYYLRKAVGSTCEPSNFKLQPVTDNVFMKTPQSVFLPRLSVLHLLSTAIPKEPFRINGENSVTFPQSPQFMPTFQNPPDFSRAIVNRLLLKTVFPIRVARRMTLPDSRCIRRF